MRVGLGVDLVRGGGRGGGPALGAAAFAQQTNTDHANLGADGWTWAQGNPLTVDKFGKWLGINQLFSPQGHRFVFTNDLGATWGQSSVAYNFLLRGALAYDAVNDLVHVCWVGTAGSDGAIYRRYTISRDGSNNITDIVNVAAVNLQLAFDTNASFEQPVALWLSDAAFGTFGKLVLGWCQTNASNGQVMATSRVLSNSAADNTGSNWVRLDGTATANSGLLAGGTYNVAITPVSDGADAAHMGCAIFRSLAGSKLGDLYFFFATDLQSVWFRRFPFATPNWSAGTTKASLGTLVSGGGRTEGQEYQLLSKPAQDPATGRIWLGWQRWNSGEAWVLSTVSATDVVSAIIEVYNVGGQFLPAVYAVTGDICFDATTGLLVTTYVNSTANDLLMATYNSLGAQTQLVNVFSAANVDIPLIYQDPRTGNNRVTIGGKPRLILVFRDTDGGPPPPYRGWWGSLTLA